jgi:hypothetical protein
MRRLRQLAERTPAERERYADLLRALAITVVVLGHWLATVIGYDQEGQLDGRSALPDLPWAQPVTWLLQVIPVFFLVGGYANAASLEARQRRGQDAIGWLQDRSGRLIRPTTVLVLVLAGAALVAQRLGAEPDPVRHAVWFATIPLWFLVAYLGAVVLTPVMHALHRRFGWAVPLVLVGLVAVGDLGRLSGSAELAIGNVAFGWLAIHQVGFAWRDEHSGKAQPGPGPAGLRAKLRAGRLPAGPRVAVPLLLGGLAALLLLTLVGPYPISMIDMPGNRVHNMTPPSLAMIALATSQLGFILLLRDAGERWLRRSRAWLVVIAVNSVVLTIFLWHVSAAILVAGTLHALHALPTPAVGTTVWWLWRLPWLVALTATLAALVAVFGPVEMRSARRLDTRPRWIPVPVADAVTRPAPRLLLTVGGYTAAVLGLLGISLAPEEGKFLFGLPTAALVAFLAGAGLLRLLRSLPDQRR